MAPFGDVTNQEKGGNGAFRPARYRIRAVVNAHGSVENVLVDVHANSVVGPEEEMYFSNQNYLDSQSDSSGSLSDYLSASAPRALSTDSEIEHSSSSDAFYSSLERRVLNSELDATPNHWMNVIYDISDAPEYPPTAVIKKAVATNISDSQNDIKNESEEEKERSGFTFWGIFTCCFKKTQRKRDIEAHV